MKKRGILGAVTIVIVLAMVIGRSGCKPTSEEWHALLSYDENPITIQAGETKAIEVTLETHKQGPGEVYYQVFMVTKLDEEEELLPPDLLECSIEPSQFKAYPDNIYYSTIIIKASPTVLSGEYWLLFEWNYGGFYGGKGYRSVTVE